MKKKLFAALTAALMLGSTMAAPVSAAETYKKGDVNMDGEITVADAQMVLEQFTVFLCGKVEGCVDYEQHKDESDYLYYHLTAEQEQLASITGGTTKSLEPELHADIPFHVLDAQCILMYSTEKLAGKEVPDNIEDFVSAMQRPEETRYGREIGGVFYEMGDVTMDGVIDYYDATEALQLYTEMVAGTAQFEERMLLCSVFHREGVYVEIDKKHPEPEDLYGKGPDPKEGFMWWPFDVDDAQYLWVYVNLRQVHEDLTMQAFLDMTKDEVAQMLAEFRSHYRAVLNDQIGASAMGVVPIGTPDGFFVDGQYIVYGDLNMNGRFDEGDAELYELIAQEYEAAAAAAGGFEFSLRDEQYALASPRYINSEGKYCYIYRFRSDYPKMAALIRQYVAMSEAGEELPPDLGNFYEQYIAGQENP